MNTEHASIGQHVITPMGPGRIVMIAPAFARITVELINQRNHLGFTRVREFDAAELRTK